MSKKKQAILIAAGSVIFVFLLVWYLVIQIYCAQAENAALSGFELLTAGLGRVHEHPFEIRPIPWKSLYTTFIIFLLLGFVVLFVVLDTLAKKHANRDTALGDAHYLAGKELEEYNKQNTEPFGKPTTSGFNNIILAQELYQSMDNEKTNRNCNVLNIAGSGRGKSFRYIAPNLLQANASYVTTDPSGGLYRSYGTFFEHKGYKVKAFNLTKMNQSNHYNPFHYIHSDKDIMILVDVLIANTTPPESHAGDPLWEKAEAALLNAVIALQWHYMEENKKNFSTTLNLIREGQVNNENSPNDEDNQLAQEFDFYRPQDPNGFAFKQYGNFILGAGKTIKSILVSCAFRLKGFDLEDIRLLTQRDDIDLDSIGDEKTALFIIIPTGSKTFNFLAAMMYSQLFMRMYDYCEESALNTLIVRDKKGEVIKTFRADTPDEIPQAEALAKKFMEDIKHTQIVYNKQLEWYEVRTKKQEDGSGNAFIAYRKTEEEAKEAQEEMKSAELKKNDGEHMPIHVRMMLDEMANVGQIPDLDIRIATTRKYAISISIVIQSLKQLQKLYEKEWDTITSNCDNVLYMGGGADQETTKWLSELIGKETRQVASNSFNKGSGGMSISSQSVELMAAYQLRTLDKTELIDLPVGLPPFRGKMYDTTKHPNWKYVKGQPKYKFTLRKTNYFISEEMRSPYRIVKKDPEKAHGGVASKDSEAAANAGNDELNAAGEQQAAEYSDGITPDGVQIVTDPDIINDAYDTMPGALGITNAKELQKAQESLIELNRSLSDVYSVYSEAPIDFRRQAAG